MKASALIAVLCLEVSVFGSAPAALEQQTPAEAQCNVTVPNDVVAGLPTPHKGSYGNAQLSAGPFGLWPNGTITFYQDGAGFITSDGALGMKFGWTRGIPGKLKVNGHRLDAQAPPLRLDANDGYGDKGFQATALVFPTPGCWEVNAQVGNHKESRITIITKVVKLGDPQAHYDPPKDWATRF